MDSQKKAVEQPKTPVNYKQRDDFRTAYANNTFIESNAWDLKLVFGEVADINSNLVRQHTAITLPWSQVKVLIYLMQIHLMGHEAEYGRVPIPKGVIMPFPAQMPRELEGRVSAENYGMARKLYESLIAANPEAAIPTAPPTIPKR